MNPCVIIPVFNHAATLPEVVRGAQAHCPVIVVDDGSTDNLVIPDCATAVRFAQNRGKAAALRAGFAKAAELGFTHAISMDADGQHFPEDLPAMLAEMRRKPEALLVGVRDFVAAGAPARRRRANALSQFWFHVATGVKLGDAQCGFRCYPLAVVQRLRVRAERYAYELEILIRAAWAGVELVPVAVRVRYDPSFVRGSHFRPIADFVKITNLQSRFVLQAWLVPAELRAVWAVGGNKSSREVLGAFFHDHAQNPVGLAGAVGLGLFCGLAPIWGFQMVAAVALAHWFKINKAITLLASNVSLPPFMPLILYADLLLGHWLLTGEQFELGTRPITWELARQFFGTWLLGSAVLAVTASLAGIAVTYGIARCFKRR
ncbi:MAG: Undecaprenyl-phosphate 4-deoxy-4-formamido-L-arabinose transferase [Verrucomicrobiae bacterium]|nr:Undecaprenyl-phosphate 4-deoxy-4-formamido-L-arabinose transferase [Verrucomicrobiae bacterium]